VAATKKLHVKWTGQHITEADHKVGVQAFGPKYQSVVEPLLQGTDLFPRCRLHGETSHAYTSFGLENLLRKTAVSSSTFNSTRRRPSSRSYSAAGLASSHSTQHAGNHFSRTRGTRTRTTRTGEGFACPPTIWDEPASCWNNVLRGMTRSTGDALGSTFAKGDQPTAFGRRRYRGFSSSRAGAALPPQRLCAWLRSDDLNRENRRRALTIKLARDD
jgi:hypothetical protein